MQIVARNLGWAAFAGVVLLAIGWVALGYAPVRPASPERGFVLEQTPPVDLDRLDEGAATMPIPRAALADAVRKCRLFGRAEDCRFAELLKAKAAKAGLD